MKLIGYRMSSFTAKDTGEVIRGYNLYLSGPEEKVEGLGCERVFVSEKKMGDYQPHLGDELSIVYNRFGKVRAIAVSAVK